MVVVTITNNLCRTICGSTDKRNEILGEQRMISADNRSTCNM